MGHGSGPAADQPGSGCRVLPVIQEEPEPEGSPEMTTTRLAERRKAIVARMRELLGRAAAAQSAHSKLRHSTLATAKKWKRAVGRIQRRGRNNHQQVAGALQQDDGSTLSRSSSSISSQSSFTWDASAAATTESCFTWDACSSPASLSPLLWPAAFVSAWRADQTAPDQRRRQLAPSPAATVLRLSCGSSSWSEDDDDDARMAHWVTTDSDFVVLEL